MNKILRLCVNFIASYLTIPMLKVTTVLEVFEKLYVMLRHVSYLGPAEHAIWYQLQKPITLIVVAI